MPPCRRVRRVLWRSGQVQDYDGCEFGLLIPPERSNWIWNFNDHGYYMMFDVGAPLPSLVVL